MDGPVGFNEGISIARDYETRKEAARAQFFKKPKLLKRQSEIEGRAVYIDEVLVRVVVPGQNKSEFVGPATPEMKKRFAGAWEAFQKGEKVAEGGTPLEVLSFLSPAQVMMLKALNIYSAEDLATLPDSGVEKIGMGGLDMRKKATAFITPAPVREQELRKENEELKGAIRNLESRIRNLENPQPEEVEKHRRRKAD